MFSSYDEYYQVTNDVGQLANSRADRHLFNSVATGHVFGYNEDEVVNGVLVCRTSGKSGQDVSEEYASTFANRENVATHHVEKRETFKFISVLVALGVRSLRGVQPHIVESGTDWHDVFSRLNIQPTSARLANALFCLTPVTDEADAPSKHASVNAVAKSNVVACGEEVRLAVVRGFACCVSSDQLWKSMCARFSHVVAMKPAGSKYCNPEVFYVGFGRGSCKPVPSSIHETLLAYAKKAEMPPRTDVEDRGMINSFMNFSPEPGMPATAALIPKVRVVNGNELELKSVSVEKVLAGVTSDDGWTYITDVFLVPTVRLFVQDGHLKRRWGTNAPSMHRVGFDDSVIARTFVVSKTGVWL
jgi:hypothetical protein